MSASSISSPCYPRLPNTQTKALELAYRMVQVGPNADKVARLFADNAVFEINNVIYDKRSFFEEFKFRSIENITAIGPWTDTFVPASEGSKDILWKVEGYQYRLGNGLSEDGEGWYRCDQEVRLTFNGERKITSFKTTKYDKELITRNFDEVKALPLVQKKGHKLAYLSFQIPQNNEEMEKMYDEEAVVSYLPDRRYSKKEFLELMKTSNTDNVCGVSMITNEYSPIEGERDSVQWQASVIQYRLGKGVGEEGPGVYRIHQTADVSFKDSDYKVKIISQKNFGCSKIMLHDWDPFSKRTNFGVPRLASVGLQK